MTDRARPSAAVGPPKRDVPIFLNSQLDSNAALHSADRPSRPTSPRSVLDNCNNECAPQKKSKGGVNASLNDILDEQAKPLLTNHLNESTTTVTYRVFEMGKVLLPQDLTYNAVVLKPRMFRKPVVAPGPEIARKHDTFHQLNLDPRKFTTNGAVLSHFVSEMGKIKSRDRTLLTLKSQRLLGRTIRRAKMMGVIPTLSRGTKH
ncbi:hypothetical protein BDZ97DRAFT_2069159 [Flammula alnicola]|nr:hypothetical protein BDZ97DRAFT_2069159 [Flammula alnicola]